jgi:hypothetical protein
MDAIHLIKTDTTPGIHLDKKNNIFLFEGISLPEKVHEFYKPVLEWLDDYVKNSNSETIVIFKLDFYSTTSSKLIYEILSKFNFLYEEGKKVEIEWHFSDEDEDMEESGEELADLLSVPFTFKSYISE